MAPLFCSSQGRHRQAAWSRCWSCTQADDRPGEVSRRGAETREGEKKALSLRAPDNASRPYQ